MTSDAGPPGAPRFNVVLRGYDRRQVDEHVARLQRVIARMRADLSARNQYGEVPGYGPPPRGPLPPGRPGPMPGPGGPVPRGESPDAIGGFTDRMQRILQSAEDEAEEIRNRARAAARAESEQMRAQLDELARQRDLMMRELTALRGQLPESERTDRMPHPGVGGPGKDPARSGMPTPRPRPSAPVGPGGPDAHAGAAPAGPGGPDARTAPAAGSGRPDARTAPAAGPGPGPESHPAPATPGPAGPDTRTAPVSAGPGGPDTRPAQATDGADSRNPAAPPVAAPPGISRPSRFDWPASPSLWDNAGARGGVTPADGSAGTRPSGTPATEPDAAPEALRAAEASAPARSRSWPGTAPGQKDQAGRRVHPAAPPDGSASSASTTAGRPDAVTSDPATADSPLVRKPDTSSAPGRPSSPAEPADGSEPKAAQASNDRPGTEGNPATRPAGTPDPPAEGRPQAGPAADAAPGGETTLLNRPTTPVAGKHPDQGPETETPRASTGSTSSSR